MLDIAATSLLLFYFGVKIKIFGLVVLVYSTCNKLKLSKTQTFISTELATFLIILFFPLFAFVVQLSKFNLGHQGVDFAIYSQALDRFAKYGNLESSLFSLHYQQFLTHHFSPFLYLFGSFTKLINNAPIILIITNSISLLAAILGVRKILKLNTFLNNATVITILSCFLLIPSLRIASLWEVHDEIYAMPLLIWSLYFFINGMMVQLISSLFSLCLIKESLFLSVTMFGIMGLINECDQFTKYPRKKSFLIFLLITILSLFIFILYCLILPGLLFKSSFNGFERISSLIQFTDLKSLQSKIWWGITILLPVAPLLYSAVKMRLIKDVIKCFSFTALPALPSISAILISNLPNMYEPYNYYSVIPATIIFCSAVLCLRNQPISEYCIIACLSLALLFGPNSKHLSLVHSGLRSQSEFKDNLEKRIPKNSVIIAADYDVSYFYNYKQVIRLFHANRNLPYFDYVFVNKSVNMRLSHYLRSWSEIVYEDQDFIIRRAYPSRRATK